MTPRVISQKLSVTSSMQLKVHIYAILSNFEEKYQEKMFLGDEARLFNALEMFADIRSEKHSLFLLRFLLSILQ